MRSLIMALLVLDLSSGCVKEAVLDAVPDTGIELDCHARECPSPQDLGLALEIVTETQPDFDTAPGLKIEWYPSETVFARYREGGKEWIRIGETDPDAKTIRVTTYPVLAHELQHVHCDRTTGDGDGDHAGPEGGCWTLETEAQIAALSVAFAAAGLTEPGCD